MMKRSVPALCSLLVVTLVALAMFASDAAAACPTPNMDAGHPENKWVNSDPNGILKSLQIDFVCCDTDPAPQRCGPPPQHLVHARLPCASGYCTLSNDAHYIFWDRGRQASRIDVRWFGSEAAYAAVILWLEDDRLLVHWGINFTGNDVGQDFSRIEYFVKRRCDTLFGQDFCPVLSPGPRTLEPPTPRVAPSP
jgi:hypothetical protein